MENMSFAVFSFTPRQAARACHVTLFPGMMLQLKKCWFAGTVRQFLEAGETLILLSLQREHLTVQPLIPGCLGGTALLLLKGRKKRWARKPGRAAVPPWPPLRGSSLPGSVVRALHASKRKCQLIEFANDTFSQNPSRCTHHFVLATELQGGKKNAMWCHLTFRCQSNWLTGKKSTAKGPFLPKPVGRLPEALGRAGSGPSWANGMRQGGGRAEKQAPCQVILALRDVGRGNQPPPGASFSIPPSSSMGLWDPRREGGREETPTPLREGCSVQSLGRWSSLTLSEP